MRRRFQSASDSDSLELLLDTLCNVFGGIVLIACLLAILPRQQMESPLIPHEKASHAMLERRTISAREEIARLQSEVDRLSRSTDPRLAELQARRDSLRRAHEKLQHDIKGKLDREATEADMRAILSQGDSQALNEKLSVLKLTRSKSEVVESAAAEKIRFLNERAENLREEAGNLTKGRTQAVRFPRERAATSSPFPIIVRYNGAYPMALGDDFKLNPSIKRVPTSDGDGFRADPIPGQGIQFPKPDNALAVVLKAAAAKGLYATIYLYPDSHQTFADLKNALGEASLSYGLEFVKPDKQLFFATEGSSPPEL